MASVMKMEPLISLGLIRTPNPAKIYRPGGAIAWEFQIDAVDPEELQATETSLLWHTEGKGDEDIYVEYFRRSTRADAEEQDLRPLQRHETILPRGPLSYDGWIVKVRWVVRVRIFLSGGRETFFDQGFQLGMTPSPPRFQGPPPQPTEE